MKKKVRAILVMLVCVLVFGVCMSGISCNKTGTVDAKETSVGTTTANSQDFLEKVQIKKARFSNDKALTEVDNSKEEKPVKKESTIKEDMVETVSVSSKTPSAVKPSRVSAPIKEAEKVKGTPVKEEQKPAPKKEEQKPAPVKEEQPVKQESAPEKPVINSGNVVTFSRIYNGITIWQLNPKQREWAEMVMNLVRNSENDEELLETIWDYDEFDYIKTAINNTYFPFSTQFNRQLYILYNSKSGEKTRLDVATSRKALYRAEEIENFLSDTVYGCVWNGMSERDAVIAINDSVCNFITYDKGYGTLYDTIKTGRGKCSSYAYMVKELCRYIGIECQYVVGAAKGSNGWRDHAWNKVLIGSTWYYLDACWNDDAGNKYLLSEELWDNHRL